MAQVHTMRTVDHDEIRTWVEDRGGTPAIVRSTQGSEGGLLRIDFGLEEGNLEELSWDEFFRVFDENDLAFLYQDLSPDGELSYFHKFVARSEQDDATSPQDDSWQEEAY